jgi:hypothetical protein
MKRSIETTCGHDFQSAEGGGGTSEVEKGKPLLDEGEGVRPRVLGAMLEVVCIGVGES